MLAMLVLAALVTGAGWLGYRYTYDGALARQAERGQVQMRLYAQALESEIAHYDYVPGLLSLDRRITTLLARPDNADAVRAANDYLATLNSRAGTRVIYVLDGHGKVLATSNYQRPDSYLGEDLSFRPYFQAASEGQLGRFYGVGTTRSESGYYLSAPLGDRNERGAPAGVAVVKIGLDSLENRWQGADSQMLLADENGVVILASDPSWRLATLRPLAPMVRERLSQSLQYNRAPLPELPLSTVRTLDGDARLVRLRGGPPMLSQQAALPGTDWELMLLTNVSQARVAALNSAALAGVLTAFVLLLGAAWNVRRRIIGERLAARAALEAANSELERKVAERTSDLSHANTQLHAEVAERIRTEAVLRQAQAGLLQAGKLAAVGQLSAGVAHELNQPLAALRTLAGNTVKFLDRGDQATARSNLDTIIGLVERMGRITGALRSFAYKPQPGTQSGLQDGTQCEVGATGGYEATLGTAIDNALFLLDTRMQAIRPEVVRDIEPSLTVACEPNRLEQVLVNLVGNALDALAGRPNPRLTLRARIRRDVQGDMVHLTVQDNGAGLSEEAQSRLFEPFFTTKPAGQGLGLGLTLSAGILGESGGSLTANNHPDGGACFTMALPLVVHPTHPTETTHAG